MFNVMVTASDHAREEGAYVWDRTRVLEHTDDAIREPLRALTGPILEELAKLPTLFMYEQSAEGTPRVGFIRRIQQRGSEIRVIFEFDETVQPLTPEAIPRHALGSASRRLRVQSDALGGDLSMLHDELFHAWRMADRISAAFHGAFLKATSHAPEVRPLEFVRP